MIRVFTKPGCPQCKMTVQFLMSHHIQYMEYDLSKHPQYRQSLLNQGFHSAPVVMTDHEKWAGFRPDQLNRIVSRKKGMSR